MNAHAVASVHVEGISILPLIARTDKCITLIDRPLFPHCRKPLRAARVMPSWRSSEPVMVPPSTRSTFEVSAKSLMPAADGDSRVANRRCCVENDKPCRACVLRAAIDDGHMIENNPEDCWT